jgi:ribosomal protein L30/L7E
MVAIGEEEFRKGSHSMKRDSPDARGNARALRLRQGLRLKKRGNCMEEDLESEFSNRPKPRDHQ